MPSLPSWSARFQDVKPDSNPPFKIRGVACATPDAKRQTIETVAHMVRVNFVIDLFLLALRMAPARGWACCHQARLNSVGTFTPSHSQAHPSVREWLTKTEFPTCRSGDQSSFHFVWGWFMEF